MLLESDVFVPTCCNEKKKLAKRPTLLPPNYRSDNPKYHQQISHLLPRN
ncbi:unnamed protein product, partial [Vitis vinifera]